MDLLSLVARLTLDSSEYEQGLSAAEAQAAGFGGDVNGKVSLDHQEYDQGIDEATEKGEEFAGSFGDIAAKISGALVGAGIVTTIGKIASAFKDAVDDASAYADTVDKTSRRLSMSTESYQVWQHALSQSGSDISDVTRGWLNLTDAVAGSASDDVANALKSLSIDPAEFATTEQLFDMVISSLAEISSGAERDSIVTALFGRGGNKLNALLDSGKKGIADLKQEAYDLGLVMSDQDIASGVAYGDAIANMNAAVEALKQNVVAGLFPVLTDAAKMITSIVAFFNGRATEETLQGTFASIDEELGNMLSTTETNELEAKSLVDQLLTMQEAASQSEAAFNVWVGTAQELIKKCPELSSAIDLTTGSFTKSKEEIYADIEALTARAKAMALQNALSQKLAALTAEEQKAIEAQIDVNMKRASSEAANAKAIERANELLQKYGGTFESYDFETNEFVQKNQVESLEDVNRVLAELSNRRGVDWDELGGLSDLATAADDADTALIKSEESLAAFQEEIAKAEDDYQQYATAVQQMIDELTGFKAGLDAIPNSTTKTVNIVTNNISQRSDGLFAKGLNYVPYDGYTAILHRGETVLNQAQARQYRSGESGGAQVDMSALQAAIVGAVQQGMANAQVDAFIDGRRVTDEVSRRLNTEIGLRR